ncbi:hypothetical protein Pelo_101 [Pelomyxa schiedti]|nr:hypothetical protein Pelo_101 [Pelomyxa schiedti]
MQGSCRERPRVDIVRHQGAIDASGLLWRVVVPRVFSEYFSSPVPAHNAQLWQWYHNNAPVYGPRGSVTRGPVAVAFCGCTRRATEILPRWHELREQQQPAAAGGGGTNNKKKKKGGTGAGMCRGRRWPTEGLREHMRHWEGAREEVLCKCGEAMFPLRGLVARALMRRWGGPLSALCAAATHGCVGVADWVLCNEDYCGRWGGCGRVWECPGPISFAVGHGHAEFARWFAGSCFDRRQRLMPLDTEGGNALCCACLGGRVECVELFDRSRRNAERDTLESALCCACVSGSVATFEYVSTQLLVIDNLQLYLDAVKNAASVGSLDLCRRLFKFPSKKFPIVRSRYISHVLGPACECGEMKVIALQELLEIPPTYWRYLAPKLAGQACKYDCLNLLEQALQRQPLAVPFLVMMSEALKHNHVEAANIVLRAWKHDAHYNLMDLIQACCETDSIVGIEWLHETFGITDKEIHSREFLSVALQKSVEIHHKHRLQGVQDFVAPPPKFLVASFLASTFDWHPDYLWEPFTTCCQVGCAPAIDWFFCKFDMDTIFPSTYIEILLRRLLMMDPPANRFTQYCQLVPRVVDWIAPKITFSVKSCVQIAHNSCPIVVKAFTKHSDLTGLGHMPLARLLKAAAVYDTLYQKKIAPETSILCWLLKYFHPEPHDMGGAWISLCKVAKRPGCMDLIPVVHELSPLSRLIVNVPEFCPAFMDCVSACNFKQAKWMADNLPIKKEDLTDDEIVLLCHHSHESLKWLCKNFSLTKSDSLVNPKRVMLALGVHESSDKKETAKWFIHYFRLTPADLNVEYTQGVPLWLKETVSRHTELVASHIRAMRRSSSAPSAGTKRRKPPLSKSNSKKSRKS